MHHLLDQNHSTNNLRMLFVYFILLIAIVFLSYHCKGWINFGQVLVTHTLSDASLSGRPSVATQTSLIFRAVQIDLFHSCTLWICLNEEDRTDISYCCHTTQWLFFFIIFQDSKTKLEFFSIEKIKEKYIVDMGINIWSEGFDKLSVPINIRQ